VALGMDERAVEVGVEVSAGLAGSPGEVGCT